jgi:flavodoxin
MISTSSLSHEEYLRKKRKKKLWKLGGFLFFIIFLVGLSSYLSHRKEVRVSKIELEGGVLVTEDEVSSKSLAYMHGSHFWLYPRNNALWYPRDELEQYLKENFRRIDGINIERKGFETLVVKIKERKPFALWCEKNIVLATSTDETPDTKRLEDCYFIDQNSTIFAKAPTFSGDAYFKYYGSISSTTESSPIGKEFMSNTKEFGDISNFVSKTKELKIKPLYIVAKENGEFSMFISGGGEIYFDTRESLSTVGQNLEALLRTPVFASSTGNLPIEHIDLRYGNKLFYKLKQ